MMLRLIALAPVLVAGPAFAAGDYPFFSLYNTDLIVLMAFLCFLGILVYFKVPAKVSDLLDSRSVGIQSELDEARRLREDALALHASFERRQAEVKDDAARIVEKAKADAQLAADQAKAEIEASITRRLKAAGDQIASAEASALREVRDRAVSVAVAAAGDVLAKQMDAERNDALVQKAIGEVQTRLH
jgi:F-type H+-transporting ATPase subunit b